VRTLQEFYNVGKLVNTHGINGEVRVISITDFPEERYKKGAKLFLFLEDQKEPIQLIVNSWRRHKNFDLLTFEGLSSINDVEKFKGGKLKVTQDQLKSLEENEFYFHEIIGCSVVDAEGTEYGKIKEILSPGANDVWVVKGKDRKEFYIPYIDEVVKKVDVSEKVVLIEPMEGLLD
jgi:16S rRNA processing protein RimM